MLAYRIAPLLATLVLAMPAAHALARTPESQTHIGIVSTSGLDLASDPGQAELLARVRREVRRVCGTPEGFESRLAASNAVRQCRVDALRDAQAQMASLEQAAMLAKAVSPPPLSSAMN